MVASSSSSSSPTSSDSPYLADLVNYLSYLAHKGVKTLPSVDDVHKALPSLNDVIKRARSLSNASRAEQMDALTTGVIAVTIISAVAFFLYKMYGQEEDTFAKARDNKQIYTLEDAMSTKNDKKEKERQQQKKKEEKKKKAAAAAAATSTTSADSKEDKPAAAAAAAAPTTTQESPVSAPAPKKETAKKEQPKPEEPKKMESKKEAEPVAVKKEEAAPLHTAAPEPKKSAPQSNGEKKANKKAAQNKQIEEIENEEEFVEAKTKKAKKIEKKEAAPAAAAGESTAPRHLSLKDLDTNKVVARLSSIDELELEYLEYLNNFFRDTHEKNVKALTDNVRAERLANESARALATVKAEKAKLEAEMESNRRMTNEVVQKMAASGSEAQEAKSQLASKIAELDKLARELDTAKKTASSVVIPIIPDNKEEVEKLKADAKSAASRIADLEETLKNAKETAAKERKQFEQSVLLQKTREDAAVGQEVLLAESRQNAKAISQRLTELEQVKETLEARAADAAKQVEQLMEEAKKREASHLADTNSLKTMIEELNKEVHRFEEAKKEQAEVVAKLAAKEAELAKKSAALEEAQKEISAIKKGSESSNSAADAQIASLTKRVSELEQSLADAEKRAAEIVIPVAEPAKKEADVEEIVELKKSVFLNAAPPVAVDNSAELAALKEENAELKREQERLHEKNTELRTRSHTMNDQLNELEKRLASSSKVSNGVGPSAPSATPAAAATQEKGSKKSKKGGDKKEATPPPAAAPTKEEKKDEEERVRGERRLVVSHIGKVIGGAPALDEAADAKAYEQWLKSVAASIKDAQEKAKKSQKEQPAKSAPAPAPAVVADDAEKEELRKQNDALIDALATLEHELTTIEQLKSEREASYARRIAELEKTHGKAK